METIYVWSWRNEEEGTTSLVVTDATVDARQVYAIILERVGCVPKDLEMTPTVLYSGSGKGTVSLQEDWREN